MNKKIKVLPLDKHTERFVVDSLLDIMNVLEPMESIEEAKTLRQLVVTYLEKRNFVNYNQVLHSIALCSSSLSILHFTQANGGLISQLIEEQYATYGFHDEQAREGELFGLSHSERLMHRNRATALKETHGYKVAYNLEVLEHYFKEVIL